MAVRPVHVALAALAALGTHDLLQRRHAITRNFPIVGHARYALESIGPELRQYIVTDNDQERPFTRDQRRWVYTSAKGVDNHVGFGTDNDIEHATNYVVIKHAAFPRAAAQARRGEADRVASEKVLGAAHGRARSFRPESIVNLSAMSFGALSGPAIEALNRAAASAGCLHNTGEGGISPHHRHGGELVWQIGTGYFGCRDKTGNLVPELVAEVAASAPVRAIEIKLSQGAKAGLGGFVPGAKVTPEIAELRRIPVGQDCISPPYHRAFDDVDTMIDTIEHLAQLTGLPVGIKSAVGEQQFWDTLAARMADRREGPDFITVDGGEGGTGAAPLVFSDHLSLPFRVAFPRVHQRFAEAGLAEDIVFIGSGKLGFPEQAALALAMGCDLINVGREAMLSIGCIQAQRCHTGRCPTGVATQNRWLQGGVDPVEKAARCASYITTLRAELVRIAVACGCSHPAQIPLDAFELLDPGYGSRPAREVLGYPAAVVAPT